MNSSEVTPTVWNITMSTSRPMLKPAIAPGIDPASRPIDITTSEVTSAVAPNSEICETTASWITTARNATAAIRRARCRFVESLFIAARVLDVLAVVGLCQDLHEAQVLEVCERRHAHLRVL